jgi:hypothetical protein
MRSKIGKENQNVILDLATDQDKVSWCSVLAETFGRAKNCTLKLIS